MAPWLSPLLKLWARLRVRAIISPAQALGHLSWGKVLSTSLPLACLQALMHSLPPPAPCPGPGLSLPLVPCLEPQGMKLGYLGPEEE